MISDSSSLIIFAKINKLDILFKLYGRIQITKGICEEIVEQGLVINAPDAKILKKFVDGGKIQLLSLDEKHRKMSKELIRIYFQLGVGESDAIILALQENKKKIIMDEALGRKVAKLNGLVSVGSLRILLESYKKEVIKEKELRAIVSEMIRNKFRIGGDVVDEFWILFERMKKGRRGLDL